MVEVQCQQTFPYVSFIGQTLVNHSYVDISVVGNDGSGSDNVQCHTDLESCCSEAQGIHCGDWYSPNGARLPFPDGSDIVEACLIYLKDLNFIIYTSSTVMGPTGIYHCNLCRP